MKYIVIVFSLMILFSGCNNREKHDLSAGQDLYIVDFEQCLTTEREMKISEIADTIEYLELKTPKDVIVTRIRDIIPIDNYLFLHTTYGIFKFTMEGDFVKEIGKGGQGPGEYSLIFNIEIDSIKREIIISDSGKQLFYDLEGNFIRMEKWGTLFRVGVSDSVFWVGTTSLHVDEYIAFALNSKGDTVASLPNPIYGAKSLNEGIMGILPKSLKMFYRHNGSLYMKGETGNDTISQLSGINRTPYAFINRGKYKLPAEYEPWYSNDAFEKNGHHYWGVPAVAEDDRYLFLLSQRYNPIDGDFYNHNEENFRYIVYDKEKRRGFVTKDQKRNKITDDILGGPSVWPHWITDDYYINVIEAHDLLNEVEKGGYTLVPSLEKQLAGFDYGTNELIILCRRKK